MTVTAVRKDPHALSLTLDAEFDASPERVWQLWSDPRQLERWWGPPTYPATFTKHDLKPGGRVEYHMTGPEGDQPHAYWEVQEVDPPHSLVVRDSFANDDGSPNTEMPTNEFRVTIEKVGAGRTRMSIVSIFSSTEAMEQLLAFGMEQGLTQAVGQIDAILTEDAAGQPTGGWPMAESPLGRLAGTWELEPLIEGRSAGKGHATFEWIEGGAFLLERSVAEWTDPGWVENAPKTTQSVIGFDDTTLEVIQLYADDRGVTRIYRGTLTDDRWRLERAAPDFHQRFVGEFRDDGRTIDGRWESSPDGTAWELDFPITYRRSETTS